LAVSGEIPMALTVVVDECLGVLREYEHRVAQEGVSFLTMRRVAPCRFRLRSSPVTPRSDRWCRVEALWLSGSLVSSSASRRLFRRNRATRDLPGRGRRARQRLPGPARCY
jgi:hypothetical protein